MGLKADYIQALATDNHAALEEIDNQTRGGDRSRAIETIDPQDYLPDAEEAEEESGDDD